MLPLFVYMYIAMNTRTTAVDLSMGVASRVGPVSRFSNSVVYVTLARVVGKKE